MGPCATVMKRMAVLFAVWCCLFTFHGAAAESAKPLVIATLFPQYDFARQIAADKADVRLLLPPGAESHSYEPSPADMKTLSAADLFIYTGEHMEPWAKRLAESTLGDGTVRIVDASTGIIPIRGDAFGHGHDEGEEHGEHGDEERDGHEEHDGHDGHDDNHDAHSHDSHAGEGVSENGDAHYHEFDPHIWLDPVHAATMVDTIVRALAERDPANAGLYRENGSRLRSELEELDRDFRQKVAGSGKRVLVFGDRFAFVYFFSRYGLEAVGPYRSCAPGAEPGLRSIIEVVDFIKANGTRHIYKEAMSTGRIAQVLREEAGVEIVAVDSLHNLSADKLRKGATFVSVMRENMDAFAKELQ